MNLENVVLLSTFAERHDLDYVRLRRMARKNEFEPAFKFGSDWMINADTIPPVIPERKTRTRSDGRSRFIAYIDRDGDELAAVRAIVGHDNVVDLRDIRAARKLAAAAPNDATITAVFGNGDNRVCEHCGEIGDPQCFDGNGTCATANAAAIIAGDNDV